MGLFYGGSADVEGEPLWPPSVGPAGIKLASIKFVTRGMVGEVENTMCLRMDSYFRCAFVRGAT
ncbi:hypothetical protein TIFTF001_016468 [Ficus carica]|uniref:Uncharacterized protein n=1 Tax=Ficus carica TaxID=3494 RepID=A0AA88D672_FICCA|nr:hypothetical protein TIFTF001_016468 [Ficus carica]